jgi:hypothetical protein
VEVMAYHETELVGMFIYRKSGEIEQIS